MMTAHSIVREVIVVLQTRFLFHSFQQFQIELLHLRNILHPVENLCERRALSRRIKCGGGTDRAREGESAGEGEEEEEEEEG